MGQGAMRRLRRFFRQRLASPAHRPGRCLSTLLAAGCRDGVAIAVEGARQGLLGLLRSKASNQTGESD